jgi:hypothetical protein
MSRVAYRGHSRSCCSASKSGQSEYESRQADHLAEEVHQGRELTVVDCVHELARILSCLQHST